LKPGDRVAAYCSNCVVRLSLTYRPEIAVFAFSLSSPQAR
jgi:hypothetical protein